MSREYELKLFCRDRGADYSGVADLEPFRKGLPVLPAGMIDPFRYAVSVAVRLNNDIIDGIVDRPTPQYSQLCRDTNVRLDRIASDVAGWIEKQGFHAKAIPATLWVDTEALLGNISHKAVARMAGLGWQGKSLLIVNKECGPRMRLATVLTDMPLEPDGPVRNLCGKCTACTDACPASAIKNTSTTSHYKSREDAIHLKRCYGKLLEFKKMPEIGYTFCGVCIQVCPFGKKKSRKKQDAG